MQAAVLAVTFFRDVLPILQNHCQECHRPGQMAPMPLRTYEETRPWAKAIRDQVRARKMPPWFGEGFGEGHFANDRSLSAAEIETLSKWADTGAEKGDLKDAPAAKKWPEGWNLPTHDMELAMPNRFQVPASGAVE